MYTDISNIHNIQFEMLKIVKKICEENNLEYYLAQGTLLGAVRHKGFIPWDDDIDLLMPANDLEKFSIIFRKLNLSEYFLEDYHTEEFCPYLWTKIRKNNTTSMPIKYKDMPVHWGICIDIFPYFPAGNNYITKCVTFFKFKVAKKMLEISMAKYESNIKIRDKFVLRLPIIFRKNIFKIMLKSLNRGNKNTKYILASCKGGKLLKRVWMKEKNSRYLQFENERFAVPEDYDSFLSYMFGDYMTLPSEKEQKGHELRVGEIIWDLDKSYNTYK